MIYDIYNMNIRARWQHSKHQHLPYRCAPVSVIHYKMRGEIELFFSIFFFLSWGPQAWCSEWHLWQAVYGPRCALKVVTYGAGSVPPGPKSLAWILKRVD